MIRGNVF
jgi:hypothetical protein